MSSQTAPISPTRFAAALTDLPISALYAKAFELRNSLTHLRASNDQLAEFPDDKDCAEAIAENEETMQRMEDRVLLIEYEVTTVRGLPWKPDGEDEVPREQAEVVVGRNRIGDEELARRLEERLREDEGEANEDGDGSGVYL
jgi:hypothetical protein